MPIRSIDGSDAKYYLIVFDEFGIERRESDGTLMSETVLELVADTTTPVTDVFVMSHGWLGDVNAAVTQFDGWMSAMSAVRSDRLAVQSGSDRFHSLTIGLHWPSLPWGDETIPTGHMLLSASDQVDGWDEDAVSAYASRIADTLPARAAIRTILQTAGQDATAATIHPEISAAYEVLFAESGLAGSGAAGRPGSDQDGFDPAEIIRQAHEQMIMPADHPTPGLLGAGIFTALGDLVLAPLRQISFWKMKDRARAFGETGGHLLVRRLQLAAPAASFHLMGHSFGSIVVTAAVAGSAKSPPLPRPVETLFLVQGALSLWAFAQDIPYATGTPGYFSEVVQNGLVRGAIVTTRSTFDRAVGWFYPLGAQLRKQLVLGEDYPAFGGIGAFGITGLPNVADMPMQSTVFNYNFGTGRVYNLEASAFIKNGGGPAGAHNDIAHPEVAHAFWSAVMASRPAWNDARPGGPLPTPWRSPDSTGIARFEAPSSTLLGAVPVIRSFGEPPVIAAPPAATPVAEANDLRWVNAEIENHAADQPLAVGLWYKLTFDVDLAPRFTALAVTRFDAKSLFADDSDEVELSVQLDSATQADGADFEISDHVRPLRFSRDGKHAVKAQFFIQPQHYGPSIIKATIHKAGNFISQLELTFDVGVQGAKSLVYTTLGRPLSAAAIVHPRDIGLSITPAVGGYDCVVWGGVTKRARLPIDAAFFSSIVDNARRALMKVVTQRDAAGVNIFQVGIDIPQDQNTIALQTLARAGSRLFQQLFYTPGAGADLTAVGDFLQAKVSDPSSRLTLQIVAEHAPVPWGMLYVGDVSLDAQLSWDNFIGMRHIIEQIPLQNSPTIADEIIRSDNPRLSVSVNVNSAIDAQFNVDYVARQQAFWTGALASGKNVRVTPRTRIAEVVRALNDTTTDDQILYFYCHALSAGLTDAGGVDASCITLTDGKITLADLNALAPTSKQLAGNPFVFINACESAEMSAAFYDGFVPYFMAKGARGVVGTECQTPALFASVWADRFFELLLAGEPLGQAFLALRREFLEQHRNPLGLCYAVYCDGDTQIVPALAVTA